MKTVETVIQGMSALLMSHFELEDIDGAATKKVRADRQSPEEAAKKLLYVNADGQFYMPSSAIARLLREAASNHKIRGTRRSAKYLVPAAVRIIGTELPLLNPKGELLTHFAVDSRSGVNPSTKGRIVIHRPMFPEWRLNISLRINETLLATDFVKKLLIEGGSCIGIGSFRPEKGGEFGTFQVMTWKEEPGTQTA